MKRLIALAVAFMAAFGLQTSLGAVTAQAVTADTCSSTQYCGRIVNSIYSTNALKISNRYPATSTSTMWLPVGSASSYYTSFRDVDAVYIASGCQVVQIVEGGKWTTYGPAWKTVRDYDNIALIYTC